MNTLIKTERGWAGHFICSYKCRFRRNTLVEYMEERFIISTVGLMYDGNGGFETLGADRYYETMAFKAEYDGQYWDADVCEQIYFNSKWSLLELDDNKANDMHEDVVKEISNKILKGEIK